MERSLKVLVTRSVMRFHSQIFGMTYSAWLDKTSPPKKGEIGEIVILCHLSIKHIKQICVRIKNTGEINIVLPSPVQIKHPHCMVPDMWFRHVLIPYIHHCFWGVLNIGWGCWGGYNHIKAPFIDDFPMKTPFIEKYQASHV